MLEAGFCPASSRIRAIYKRCQPPGISLWTLWTACLSGPPTRDPARVERIGPELHELLHDADPFEVRILGRMALAESAMEERPVTQGPVLV